MKAPSPHHVWQRDLQISSLPALLTLVTVTSKPCEWHFVNCTGQRKFLLNENTFNYDRTCYEELSTSSFIHDFFLCYFHPTYPVRFFFFFYCGVLHLGTMWISLLQVLGSYKDFFGIIILQNKDILGLPNHNPWYFLRALLFTSLSLETKIHFLKILDLRGLLIIIKLTLELLWLLPKASDRVR